MAVKMVPTMSVVVVREGKRVKPAIGKVFDFTKEERDSILEAQPNALRKPTDESPSDDAAGDPAPPSAEASQAAAKGGKKAATANKSDDEAAKDDDL